MIRILSAATIMGKTRTDIPAVITIMRMEAAATGTAEAISKPEVSEAPERGQR